MSMYRFLYLLLDETESNLIKSKRDFPDVMHFSYIEVISLPVILVFLSRLSQFSILITYLDFPTLR